MSFDKCIILNFYTMIILFNYIDYYIEYISKFLNTKCTYYILVEYTTVNS